MNWDRVKIVMLKEWREALSNRSLTLSYLMTMAVFTVMPIVVAFILPGLVGEQMVEESDVAPSAELMMQLFPAFGDLTVVQQFQVFVVRQFIVLFLISPVMGALSVATHSIIGEKTSRSLEALLATPVRTDELLVAKSIAAALPAVLGTWIAFAFYALAVRFLGGEEIFRFAIDGTAWGVIILLTPLVALMGLELGVLVSSRVNDPRAAQQVGALVVLPLVALIVGQVSGLFLLGLPLVLASAVLLLALDVILLRIGVRLFEREQILTRWS